MAVRVRLNTEREAEQETDSGGHMATTVENEVALTRWRFTHDDYHKMHEVGILGEDDRVELIEGEVIQMSAVGDSHVLCINLLTRELVARAGSDYFVSVQNPVRCGPFREPQPDVTVFRGSVLGAPKASDVILLIEVSDTTLRYDRFIKLPLYAESGIPEVWIFDIQGNAVLRHNDPLGRNYGSVARAERGEELRSLALPEILLRVDDYFRPR